MKRTPVVLVFILFAFSVFAVQFVYSSSSPSPDEKKVTNKASEIYVYIKEGGKKYHKLNCSLVKTGKTRITLSEALKRGYTPCKICKPATVDNTMVYVNPSGKKYHKKGCKMIKKDAKKIPVAEAVKQGYTPCKICDPPEVEKREDPREEKNN